MKKIALIIITALALNLLVFAVPTGYARTSSPFPTQGSQRDPAPGLPREQATPVPAVPAVAPAGPTTPGISDSEKTFSVTQNLKLDDTNQAASYFKDENSSPIVNLIKRVIEYASYIIGSIAVILVMIAGFMFMVSQGNQQKLDEAKEIFKYAAIGLVVVFMSYIITIFIQSIFISTG